MRNEPRRIVALVMGVWYLLMLVGQGLIAPHSALGGPSSDRVALVPSSDLSPPPLPSLTVPDVLGAPAPGVHRRDAGSGSARLHRATPWGRLALAFIENRGQVDAQIKFSLGPSGHPLWLTQEGIRFALLRAKGGADQAPPMSPPNPVDPRNPLQQPVADREGLVIAQDWLGANKEPRIEASAPLPGRYHYFLGNNPAQWRTDVPSYAEVRYRDVWHGIDLKLYGNGRNLEQEFIVRAGADPSQIRVSYRGIEGLEIAADGALRIKTAFGELRESPPRIYQEIDGKRVAVAGGFQLINATTYTFDVGPYAPQYALVIDPTLVYSLVIGASMEGHAIAADAAGNSYVTGVIASAHNELATPGAFQTALAGNFGSDAYVMKLDPLGDLVYFTFLGSPVRDESGDGIAVDTDGNAYVTGWTAGPNFPTTPGAFQPLFPTKQDGHKAAFVTKLNAAGSALVYSSFLGGSEFASLYGGYTTFFGADTSARGIAVDALGNAYVAGITNAVNFPTTLGAFQTTAQGDTLLSFVTKVSPTGAALAYSTYLGGNIPGQDVQIMAIAVDAPGQAYVTGTTIAPDFPTTSGAFQPDAPRHDGYVQRSAFVTKLNPAGSALVYSTYLGGSVSPDAGAASAGLGIAADALGNSYVTGYTTTTDFPVTGGAYQTARKGYPGYPNDAFVTKLNATGSALVYSTYLGGNGVDVAAAIAIDRSGNAYVMGYTDSPDFPTTSDAFQATATPSHCFGGFFVNHCAVFVTKLNPTGSAVSYATYLFGPNTNDFGQGIAVDGVDSIYVAGIAYGILHDDDFPATLSLLLGSSALFVAKFATGPVVTRILPNAGGDSGPVTVVLVGANFQSGATVKLSRDGQPDVVADPASISDDGQTLTATFNLTGQAHGAWDVVVTNPDGSTVTLPGGFTIEETRGIQLWVDIVGRTLVEAGQEETYYVFYGNSGNIDAFLVPLWIAVPNVVALKPEFQITQPTLPPGADPLFDFSQVPLTYEDGDQIIMPLLLPAVPAGSTNALPIKVTTPTDPLVAQEQYTYKAWTTVPLAHAEPQGSLQINIDPDKLECILDAIALAAQLFLGFDVKLCKDALKTLATSLFATLVQVFTEKPGSAVAANVGYISVTPFFVFSQLLPCVSKATLKAIPFVRILTFIANLELNLASTVSTGSTCYEAFHRPPNPSTLKARAGMPMDPNDKIGSQGSGTQQYLSGQQPLRYAIYFENEATATLPARVVVIIDPLDVTHMDLSTLRLGPIAFGDKLITPLPGQTEFTTDVDLRPTQNLIVRIKTHLDPATGILTWRFSSIDPATGQPPTDPSAGFLPPNTNPPAGQGSVLFTVMPKKGLSTGIQIQNQATVVFDRNAPINTPAWLNTLDNDPPKSQVASLPATESTASFTVQWAGTDVGAGIQDYTIFVSDNSGPFAPFLTNTTNAAAMFTGQSGHTYSFYSVARDQTGNVENKTPRAEATTQVVVATDTTPPTTTATPSTLPNANGWNNTDVTVTLTAVDNPGGSGVKELSFTLSGAAIGGSTVAGNSAAVMITAEGSTTLTYFARDNAGNEEAPKTLTVQIDKTPPVISASRSLEPNANGWNNSDVTVSFSCAEVGSVQSGIDTNTVAGETLSAEGAGQSVTNTGSCTDRAGNAAISVTVSSINIDKTPPTLAGLPAPGCSLWPPNHRLVQVATVTARDALSGVAPNTFLVTGTSNEPENGLGDGDLAPDSIISGGSVQLRAERAGNGTGRTYTLTATASDLADNSTQATATCIVPHDQSKK